MGFYERERVFPQGAHSLFFAMKRVDVFMPSKLERDFQSGLIKELELIFPGCIILKNDPNYIQGFPDLTVLWGEHWALLECKRYINARRQANQKYYIDVASEMSFGAFIFPENKEKVLNDLQQAFRDRRPARVSRRK